MRRRHAVSLPNAPAHCKRHLAVARVPLLTLISSCSYTVTLSAPPSVVAQQLQTIKVYGGIYKS